MRPTRRQLLQAGLAGWAGLHLPLGLALGSEPEVEIRMEGSQWGAHVWFDPIGVHVEPGTAVRWVNLDRRQSHTATAYHPANGGYPLRIPAEAEGWDSGYLLPGESFSVVLWAEGVYDYVCRPHERAGMVGRIVVGRPDRDADADPQRELPSAALQAFPSVESILRLGSVRPSDAG